MFQRNLPLVLVIASLLLTACKSDAEKARDLYAHAQESKRQGKRTEAAFMLLRLSAEFPQTPEGAEALRFFDDLKRAQRPVTERRLKDVLATSLEQFRMHCGRYPSAAEGLWALAANPGVKGWNGPYFVSQYPSTARALAMFEYRLTPEGVPDLRTSRSD
jgi:hypothetical protein